MRIATKEWLKSASYDLLTVKRIINDELLTHIVAFHSQQAIEKSLKALMEECEIDIPKIHHLVKLNYIVRDKFLIENTEILKRLDELYIDARYPSELGLLPEGKPSIEDAREFYEFAVQVFNQVCALVEIEQEEFYGG